VYLSRNLLERIIGVVDPEKDSLAAAPTADALAMAAVDHDGVAAPAAPCVATLLIAAPAKPAAVLPAGTRQRDRRRATRLPIGDRARICLDRDKANSLWDTVMLQDISIVGISFLSSQWLTEGDGFELCMTDRAGATLQFHCRVTRCERGGMGRVSYPVGATFEALLHDGGADKNAAGGAGGESAAQEPCGGALDDTETLAPASSPTVRQHTPGALSRVAGALGLKGLAKLFDRPDDYSTSRIGRFAGRADPS
jgi:hypothetical protein